MVKENVYGKRVHGKVGNNKKTRHDLLKQRMTEFVLTSTSTVKVFLLAMYYISHAVTGDKKEMKRQTHRRAIKEKNQRSTTDQEKE